MQLQLAAPVFNFLYVDKSQVLPEPVRPMFGSDLSSSVALMPQGLLLGIWMSMGTNVTVVVRLGLLVSCPSVEGVVALAFFGSSSRFVLMRLQGAKQTLHYVLT